MGYTFTCDGCDEHQDTLPAFMGELRESWFKTSEIGGHLADMGYSPGQTVTFCGPCIFDILAS